MVITFLFFLAVSHSGPSLLPPMPDLRKYFLLTSLTTFPFVQQKVKHAILKWNIKLVPVSYWGQLTGSDYISPETRVNNMLISFIITL